MAANSLDGVHLQGLADGQASVYDRGPGVTGQREIWGSADEGESWQNLAAHLPEVYSVEAATIAS